MRFLPWLLPVVMLLVGCGKEPGSISLTKGTLAVGCDEAVANVMDIEANQFREQYTESKLELRLMEARAAISDFASDSLQVIVTARDLNDEEKNALTNGKIRYEGYKVGLSAIAVIVNKQNPITEMRVSQVDSIFAGDITRWPGKQGGVIDVVVGGVNSSTNEVFRNIVLKGRAFTMSATPIDSSSALVSYVGSHRAAIGIVNVNRLKGAEDRVTPLALGTPGVRPDSTQKPGQSYTPAQAYIYKGYYPIVTPIYMYTREVTPGVGYGFISYVSSAPGQRVFLNNGLVPATMPVRLVQLSQEQVKQ